MIFGSGTACADCVILLHGLARTSASMEKLATAFAERGYAVANVDYPSREKTIEELAEPAIDQGLAQCAAESAATVHFVTHSLGGILVRYYLAQHPLPGLGRVVMLAPPNRGSEVVDALRNNWFFQALNGPAGQQLGTGEDSVPLSLGPVDYDVGVIAGTRTFNPFLSLLLPNPDDGKVSVERTKVQGMRDFLVVGYSHPFIMDRAPVIEQAILFIETGYFDHGAP